jgi:NAD(P)-dependent dehydrogenase (short-subunit alcohol dehydrogenase family)
MTCPTPGLRTAGHDGDDPDAGRAGTDPAHHGHDHRMQAMTTNTAPVWFITGCSSGFGHELARQALARGGKLVATARDTAPLAEVLHGHEDRALACTLDVTDASQIRAAVAAAEARFGRIDVLVNNAGYGYQAAVEEGEEALIRALFDTNVFGVFALTRAVLPGMRLRRHGHVINITSVAGLVGLAGSGYYAASKHAVEGWSDSLRAEVAPLGINVSCVEPGPFRTDFAGRSLQQTPNRIADYAASAGARLKATAQSSGSQPGDPRRAAQAIAGITEIAAPPRHLVLGTVGHDAVTAALAATLAEIGHWRECAIAADFPASC